VSVSRDALALHSDGDALGRSRVALGAIFLLRTTPLLAPLHVSFLADTYPLLGWPDGHARLAPLLLLALPAVWLKALCIVRTIAALAFTAGVLAGPAGLVAGVLGYVTVTQDPGRLNTTQHVIFLGTMLLAMTDATSRCALFPAPARDLRSSRFLMRVSIASIYFWAGLAKLRPDWLDGRALGLFAGEGLVRPALGAVLLSTPALRAILANAVVLGELAIVPLLLARRTRRLGVIAALGLHAAFEAAVSPDLFGWAMAALLLGCWEPRRSQVVEPN
jgi:vitamin K-dependent gamma-carboxylase